MLAVFARGGMPVLSRLEPRGVQRGTTTTLDLFGGRLDKPLTLLFDRDGFAVEQVEAVDAGHARATLKIDPDIRPGRVGVRLVTLGGISNLKLLSVGLFPVSRENEPNNDRPHANRLKLPATIEGTIASEDIDYFAFKAAAGQRISVEVAAMRLGDTVFDPAIELYDARGAVLASADDTTLLGQDAAFSHVFEQAGTYYVAVREASYRGGATYLLHVGDFPRPLVVWPPGASPGNEIELRWLGDPKPPAQSLRIAGGRLPASAPAAIRPPATGTLLLCAGDGRTISPSPVPLRVLDLPQTLEAEPNDDPQHATAGPAPGAFAGRLGKPGDVDVFRFAAKRGQTLVVEVFGRRLGSPIDPVVAVFRPGGGRVENDDTGGPDSRVRFTTQADGAYFIQVRDLLGRGGELFVYRVEVTTPRPRLTLSLPRGIEHVAVPAGNRNAIVVNASRQGFRGALKFAPQGLPAGLSLETPAIPAGVSSFPLVFSAQAQASPAAALADLAARSADGAITGHLAQTLRLSEYQQQPMCTWPMRRLPVAVIGEVPFRVEVIQPTVPLVRNGRMQLRVRVQRAQGFKQPVSLRVLWNPPGVGSGTATCPPDRSEATIAINASGNAKLATWPLVAVATADVDGPVQICSPAAKLTVADVPAVVKLERVRVTQGQKVTLAARIEHRGQLAGPLRIELRGLPRGVSSTPVEVPPDAGEATFELTAAKDASVGRFGALHALVTAPLPGGPVQYVTANELLIVDRPLPPKKNAPAVAQAPPKAAPKKPAGPQKKKRVRLPRRPELRKKLRQGKP